MKFLKWLFIDLAVIVLAVLAFLYYMGAFSDPIISQREFGPYTFVYENFIGPYNQAGKVIDKLCWSLKLDGFSTVNAIGIYYDDPSKVSKDKLRSNLGCVLEAKDIKRFIPLKKKYKTWTIKKKQCVIAEFPFKNFLSYMIAPMKAYPVLMKYVSAEGYKPSAPIEFYDMKNGKILFIMESIKRK
ncbi:MAG: hypothetical protein NTZ10_04550 [Candidatus Saganbacteria bacterium]|nr:hypothetical protein [Candidatus Saganbacteria bacterium]